MEAGDKAGRPIAGSRAIAGLGSPEVAAETGRKAAGPGEAGLSVAKGPRGKGTAADGAPVLADIPGTPPTHIMVLAGETGFLAPVPPNMDAAVTIGLPHAWQTVTGCVAPGVVAGSGAWQ